MQDWFKHRGYRLLCTRPDGSEQIATSPSPIITTHSGCVNAHRWVAWSSPTIYGPLYHLFLVNTSVNFALIYTKILEKTELNLMQRGYLT